MSDDDKTDFAAELKAMFLRLCQGRGFTDGDAGTILASAAVIERLTADVASKDAKIERLRPKPMTPDEACDVLNRGTHEVFHWKVLRNKTGDPIGVIGCNGDIIEIEWATYIAQGLLRDAGPIATPLEQAGEESGI